MLLTPQRLGLSEAMRDLKGKTGFNIAKRRHVRGRFGRPAILITSFAVRATFVRNWNTFIATLSKPPSYPSHRIGNGQASVSMEVWAHRPSFPIDWNFRSLKTRRSHLFRRDNPRRFVARVFRPEAFCLLHIEQRSQMVQPRPGKTLTSEEVSYIPMNAPAVASIAAI
jgi:hypothetical protein